ncbi:hypothetical protein Clacol_008565 [Clathrus columnatus]|uniref:Uncharacterized protein n=1 Tax=Clathrus columnatus TaxID=1419009 RepID=A0AAV5APK0_9AGAM|nr:hypothetical protein Clacol_008565 [Clathrus columnatus]
MSLKERPYPKNIIMMGGGGILGGWELSLRTEPSDEDDAIALLKRTFDFKDFPPFERFNDNGREGERRLYVMYLFFLSEEY